MISMWLGVVEGGFWKAAALHQARGAQRPRRCPGLERVGA